MASNVAMLRCLSCSHCVAWAAEELSFKPSGGRGSCALPAAGMLRKQQTSLPVQRQQRRIWKLACKRQRLLLRQRSMMQRHGDRRCGFVKASVGVIVDGQNGFDTF